VLKFPSAGVSVPLVLLLT